MVSLPRDWRAQVRTELIDSDYDGISLRASLVDAPAGKSILFSGLYSFTPSVDGGGRECNASPVCAVAVLIVDVAENISS